MTQNTKTLLVLGTNEVLKGSLRLVETLRDRDELDVDELAYIVGEIERLKRIVARENARAAQAERPAPPKSATGRKPPRLKLVAGGE